MLSTRVRDYVRARSGSNCGVLYACSCCIPVLLFLTLTLLLTCGRTKCRPVLKEGAGTLVPRYGMEPLLFIGDLGL
jgi:hypothetical protein